MQDRPGAPRSKSRILSGLALAAGAAGLVIVTGPVTADLALNGVGLHHALIGAALIGMAGVLFALGCWRGEPSLLNPLPADQASRIAQERLREARQIIDGAARERAGPPSDGRA